MSRRRRTPGPVALAVAVAVAVAGCTVADTPPDPVPVETSSPSPTPDPPPAVTDTVSPAAPLTVVGETTDVAAALRVSRELFAGSPAAVVAPAGQPAAQEVAARAAVELGVPLLLGPATATGTASGTTASTEAGTAAGPAADAADGAVDPLLAEELGRLGASTVVAVGDVGGLGDGGAGGSPEATPGTDGPAASPDDDAPTVLRAAASAADVGALLGLALAAPASPDPATFAAGIAALAPGALRDAAGAAGPGGDAGARVPVVRRDAPLDDVVALAVDGPEQLAPLATARAAGVPVHLVPAEAPNPQATASVVEALHTAARPRTLALGAAFAVEPALEWKVRSAATGVQLPGGGQLHFPRHQLVALYGTPATGALGVLGEQDAAASVQRARDVAAGYAGLTDRTVVPMFEIIATVAAGSAGADGNFSNEQAVATLRPWVDAAAAAGIQVVLDLQPGRTDFLTQAQLYQELLVLPHVGLALDPEWRLGPDEQPLQRIGSVEAAEVNAVSRWLADLTNAHGLPPKVFVVHQFRLDMITDRAALDTSRPELAVVLHADGQGSQPAKQSTWRTLHQGAPAGVAWGWKNFLDEDVPVLTPEQTVRDVVPLPDLVTYQ